VVDGIPFDSRLFAKCASNFFKLLVETMSTSALMNVNQEGNKSVMNNLTNRFKGLFVNDGSMNVNWEHKPNNVNVLANKMKNMKINNGSMNVNWEGGRRRRRSTRKQRKSRKNRKNQRKSRRN